MAKAKDFRFKPDYQPWNEEEFWSDIYVLAMPRSAAHLYKALCNAAFFCSTRPYLPSSDSELWLHAHAEDIGQWLSYKAVILKRFKRITVGGKVLLKHKRVTADWERLRNKRETLSEHGRRGGQATQKLAQSLKPGLSEAQARLDTGLSSKRSEVREVSKLVKLEGNNQVGCEEKMAKEKTLHKRLAQVWQEVKGSEGAHCPYPHFQKEPFEDLARNHPHDVIVDAFRLYAADAPGPDKEKYPIDKFMISASHYMLVARPAVEPVIAVDPEAVKRQADLIAKLSAEESARNRAPAPERNEGSAEDFLATE